MEIRELKLGNLIKISPRANEEGVLFLTEIQHSSIIGEMLVPRKGYHFRIKFDEMLPLELSEEWLSQLGFEKSPDLPFHWVDTQNFVLFKLSNFESGFIENEKLSVVINYVHELQNSYHTLTGENLSLIET